MVGAIWMWQGKKLIMCVSREKGGDGKKRDTEGLAAIPNSDQYLPLPLLHTAVVQLCSFTYKYATVKSWSHSIVNLDCTFCAAECWVELCSVLCQFWHWLCLALINTCWQRGDDQGIRDTDKPS